MLLSVLEGASLVAWALKDNTRIKPVFALAVAALADDGADEHA
jgi:TetR/AcrR family transcriptional repressor of nem operon